jgi:potassium-transporting ATPase KdpC subunit
MIVFIVLCGVLYPLVVDGISQGIFPGNANGQQIRLNGRLLGSKIIGQDFATAVMKNGKPVLDSNGNPVVTPDPKYFQSRPSATVPAYNAAASTFANLGPNNKATEQATAANVKRYIALNSKYFPGGLTAGKVPVDAVETAASGLDPEISIRNADIQAYRIAAIRHMPRARVLRLIRNNTHIASAEIWGAPGVNVLELNLALNRAQGGH